MKRKKIYSILSFVAFIATIPIISVNAGNIFARSGVINLTAVPKPSDNAIRLDWSGDTSNKTFKVFQKKEGSSEFQSISATNLDKSKQVKVLNVYPTGGSNLSFTTWDGENITISQAGALKQWMEMPNPESPKGYGKGVIEVTSVNLATFNSNPSAYLNKNSNNDWNYDVIFFGSYDCNGSCSIEGDVSASGANIVRQFVGDGKGILMGHDTAYHLSDHPNFNDLTDLFNMRIAGINLPVSAPSSSGTVVNINKKGLLTNYPWEIGDVGTRLTIPYTHTTGQLTKGDVWMKFDGASPVVEGYQSNMYLTTWNNTGYILTGHSNGQATPDEQKLLANTLFYLNQLSTDTFLLDNSGQDVKAPTNISGLTHTFNGSNINFSFNPSTDIGSNYEYYVQAESKSGGTPINSNTVKSTITSGLAGYSYIVDNKSNTIPDSTVDTTSTNISVPITSNDLYIHIKAIDNIGNSSETIHYRVSDTVKPILNITGNPTNWTNQNVVLNISATDSGTGLREIVLPNGNKVTGSSITYTIYENGSYNFKVVDKMGNETTQTVIVDKLDKTINNISNDKSTMEIINADKNERKIKFSFNGITDNISGLKGYSYVLDKNANTMPDNNVNTSSTNVEQIITDTGIYYLHIKAIDNAGNISNVIHHKIDIPTLTTTAKPIEDIIRLDWTLGDMNNKTFKVYQKKPGSNDFQSISATNLNGTKQVRVLNIHPNIGDIINYTTWDGEVMSTTKSAGLKQWMEMPNTEHPKGYGKGLIEVTPVTIDDFNLNPSNYLIKNNNNYNYDVIVVGNWDSNGGKTLSQIGVDKVKEFIDFGGGVMLGHDTMASTKNPIYELRDYFKLEVAKTTYGNANTGKSSVSIKKKGLLTNFPWEIGDVGTSLTIPQAHTWQITNADIWLDFNSNYPNTGTLQEERGMTNNHYLTTNNNVSMVQTGHSNGVATEDEQKILANALFYLNQLSTDNFLNDNSGQDVNAPNKPTVNNHSFTEDGFINININSVVDNGSSYEYYVKSENKNGASETISNTSKTTITSGLKGYSYIIDDKPNTIPDNEVEFVTPQQISIKTNNQKELYLHIKAIDNVGNSSETTHYRITDMNIPTLTFELNPSSWTNRDVIITAKATDVGSGVKNITLPNGSIVNSNIATFTVNKNGIYAFKCLDYMGNEGVYNLTVTNIDKRKPTVTITNNRNWTNQDVNVTITATDE